MEYLEERNTLFATVDYSPRDRVEIEVGDSKQDDFMPQVKFKRWGNEVNCSFRLKTEAKGVHTREGEKIKTSNAAFYAIEGGFEFEVVLDSPPKSNVVEFTIEDKGVVYLYQGELSESEKRRGFSRPENVIGSYAVYSNAPKTNYDGSKEYGVGKVGHIYRPEIVDANGARVWGDMKIENKVLSITIPQDFLNMAAYPVIVDPTFGYLIAGASKTTVSNPSFESRLGNYYAAPESGTFSYASAYMELTSGTSFRAKFFINERDSVSADVHGQVAVSAISFQRGGKSWRTFQLQGEGITKDTEYIFSVQGRKTDYASIYYDSIVYTPENSTYYLKVYPTSTYPTPENPWPLPLFQMSDVYPTWEVGTTYDPYYEQGEGECKKGGTYPQKWYSAKVTHVSSLDTEPGVGVNWADYWMDMGYITTPIFSVYATYVSSNISLNLSDGIYAYDDKSNDSKVGASDALSASDTVSKGSAFTLPAGNEAGAVSVSGAGDADFNGIYTLNGVHNGYNYYIYGGKYLYYSTTPILQRPVWILDDELFGLEVFPTGRSYYRFDDMVGEYTVGNGTAPAPSTAETFPPDVEVVHISDISSLGLGVVATDSVSSDDNVNRLSEYIKAVEDTTSLLDACIVQLRRAIGLNFADSAAVIDGTAVKDARGQMFSKVLADSIGLSDASSLGFRPLIPESIHLNDTHTEALGLNIPLNEDIFVEDNRAGDAVTKRTNADEIDVTDAEILSDKKRLSDTASMVDALSRLISVRLAITDTLQFNDSTNVILKKKLELDFADVAALLDGTIATDIHGLNFYKQISEVMALSDEIDKLQSFPSKYVLAGLSNEELVVGIEIDRDKPSDITTQDNIIADVINE